MTPLDDELRAALSARAGTMAPSPDPLAGIEARARGMRRRRTAASVAGAALAVAAVAIAVPAVLPNSGGTAIPGSSASPSALFHPSVLDPAHPWAYRGDEALLTDGTLDAVREAWQDRHPGATLTPLFGQRWEPSGLPEVAFVSGTGLKPRVGWATVRDGKARIIQEEVALRDSAYQFALPSDEADTRLYVIAAPDSRGVDFAADGASWAPMPRPLPADRATTDYEDDYLQGVGVVAVEGRTPRVRVVASDGTVVYEADARQTSRPGGPVNALGWEPRGDASLGPDVNRLKAAFAKANGDPGLEVHYRPLFTGDTDSGVRFTVGQAWFEDDDRANTVLYTTGGTEGAELTDYGYTREAVPAVLAVVKNLPGTSVDLLVVVPRPGVTQVSYDDDATGAFRPADMPSNLDGVALIDRAKDATADRLELLDGNGDLDHPLYRGSVETLLKGEPVH